MNNTTVLMITHRLETLQNADSIWVIHEGRMIEHGRYPALLATSTLFKSLVNLKA